MTEENQTTALRPLIGSISDLLAAREPAPRLIALGEPTHGDPTFLTLRNDLALHLAEHGGLSAIALESDADAARLLDDYVRGSGDDLDRVLRDGLTHGFGSFPGNRDLLVRLRALNASRSAAEQLRCVGVDAAMELGAEDYASPERAEQRITERTTRMAGHVERTLAEAGDRGPVLVFAHDTHVQRSRSSMRLGPHEIAWDSLGSVLAARYGDRYVVILTSGSELPAHGVPAAPAGTLEHALDVRAVAEPLLVGADELRRLVAEHRGELRVREDLTPAMALGPLDPVTAVGVADALVHVPRGCRGEALTQERLREMLGALPDVEMLVAGPGTGSPEIAWGDTFFTIQPAGDRDERRMPFATLVTKDYPGFDETSDLDRDGAFALNLRVGPQFFQGLMGVAPSESAALTQRLGAATRGVVMPHPVHGGQGWVRIIDPGVALASQIMGLAGAIVERSRARRRPAQDA